MSGTREGGAKARLTNYERHGLDFYARIGSMGGKKSTTGGFASDIVGKDGLTGRQRARIAGAKGGAISKRSSRTHEGTDFTERFGGLSVAEAKALNEAAKWVCEHEITSESGVI